MPELPEVETIRMGLEQYLVGHTIKDVEILFPRIVQGETKDILGSKVTGVRRFGKGLVIDLDNKYSIAIHIKLTGQLIYSRVSSVSGVPEVSRVKIIKGSYGVLPHKSTHVIFKLDKDAKLYYNDFRRFGWIKIVPPGELQKLVFFKELGPEFLLTESNDDKEMLTLQRFEALAAKTKMPIKPLLLEQKKMSGVGNIYANDGLNLAKVDPKKLANTLSKEEIKRIFESIKTVIKTGLKYGGASELSYVNALGGEGHYQEHFLVYGQTGKPCKNCGGTIEKIMLGGRGTYFCPTCQK